MGNGRIKYQKDADGETQETKGLNNKELLQNNQIMFQSINSLINQNRAR